MELKKYKLGEICKIFGRIGFRGYTTKDLVETPYEGAISLSPSNIVDGTMDLSKCTYISWVKYEESPEIKINPDDILIVKTGNSYGRSAIIRNIVHPMTINPQFVVLKNIKINPVYLAYYIRTNEFQKQIHGIVGGSAIPTLSQESMANLIVRVPNEVAQSAIGKVLADIDRKIELNKRINDNLEAMAKQLYDYWFVQFDFPNEEGKPYKSSGGKMVWNEKLKREIPEGWKVMSVNDIAISVRGVSYAKEDMVDSTKGILVLRGNNIQDNHLMYDSNVAYIPRTFVSEDQRIQALDIIMTMSSGSKEHIGKCAMFQFESEDTYGAFLTKFTSKEHYAYLLFNLFNSQYFKLKIKSIACGTGINNLTNQTFDEIFMAIPQESLLLDFDKKQKQIFTEIGINDKSNLALTKQRDELLPLLMNGQASVNAD